MGTGLRRAELLALHWGDVRLNAPHPFIQLRAATTKGKRADVLPLRADLAELLRAAKGDADEGDPVVRALPRVPTHKTYLAKAGIPWLDSAGRRADLHALRHSYGTLLSKGGVSPREAMALMRHTDLRLTMKVYTDPRIFDLSGAVEKLPITLTSSARESARATGTNGEAVAGGGDDEAGRSKSVSSGSSGIGVCSAGTDEDGVPTGSAQPLVIDGDWRQKTPSGGDGVNERAMGFEAIAMWRLLREIQRFQPARVANRVATRPISAFATNNCDP